LESWIIGHTDEGGIARVIAVGDNEVSVPRGMDKSVEEMVMGEGVALPEEVAIEADEEADVRTGDGAVAVVDTSLLGIAGVVNVAEDKKLQGKISALLARPPPGRCGLRRLHRRIRRVERAEV